MPELLGYCQGDHGGRVARGWFPGLKAQVESLFMWKYELRTKVTGHQLENGNHVYLDSLRDLHDLFNDMGSRGWEWAGTTTDPTGKTVWVFRRPTDPSGSN